MNKPLLRESADNQGIEHKHYLTRREFALRWAAVIVVASASAFGVGVGLINIASNELSKRTDKPTEELVELNQTATDLQADLQDVQVQFSEGMDKIDGARRAARKMDEKIATLANALGIDLTTTTTTTIAESR